MRTERSGGRGKGDGINGLKAPVGSKNCWSWEPLPEAGEQTKNRMFEIEIMELGQFGVMPRSSGVTRESWMAEVGRGQDPGIQSPSKDNSTHIFAWSSSYFHTHTGKFVTEFPQSI